MPKKKWYRTKEGKKGILIGLIVALFIMAVEAIRYVIEICVRM